jgi:pimeloyl-ACP methyl ester carboxylesterase
MHRAGVEFTEFEDLKNAHRRAHCTALLLVVFLLAACTTDSTRRGYLRANVATLAPPARPVIIIPGFGVTRLLDPVRDRFVWGTAHATVQTRFDDDLDLPVDASGNIGRDRLVPRGYTGSRGPINIGWHIREGLRQFGGYTPDRDVFGFEYDWRLPARENAAKLAALVDKVGHGGKVDLITHSAGALIALTYVKLLGGANRVDHLILIAPTRRGVIDAFRIMIRPERFLRRAFTAEMVATWPSVPELLPDDGRFLVDEHGRALDRDLWTVEGWRGLLPRDPKLQRAFAKSLSDARRFRDELAAAPMHVHAEVIAGDCVPTAIRALMRTDGTFAFYRGELRPSEKPLETLLFEPGDGTVPVNSARAGGGAMLFCDGHQGIVTDPSVVRALVRILRE